MFRKKQLLSNIAISLATILVALTLFGCSSPGKQSSTTGTEDKTITLTALTSWPLDTLTAKPFVLFKEEVEKQSGGKIKIDWKGGPEAVKEIEQAESVGRGVADITFTTAAYYTSQVPEAKILDFSTLSPAEERKTGALDYLSGIMEKKIGVKFLGRGNSGRQYAFYTTKPVQSSADLKGLQLRGNPTYLPAMNSVGAKMVNIPIGEMYTSIERGVVDGTAFTNVDLITNGLHEVLKYKIKPYFWQSGSGFLFNLKKWDSLDTTQKDILLKAIESVENQYAQIFKEQIDSEDKKIQEAGMKIITLSDAQDFTKKLNEAAKTELEKAVGPAQAEELKKRFLK